MIRVEDFEAFEDGGWLMVVESISTMTGFRERTLFAQMPGGGVVQSVNLGPS